MTKAERQKRWRYNKGLSKRSNLTEDEKNQIIILRIKGRTIQKIAQKLKRSESCIGRVIRNFNG